MRARDIVIKDLPSTIKASDLAGEISQFDLHALALFSINTQTWGKADLVLTENGAM